MAQFKDLPAELRIEIYRLALTNCSHGVYPLYLQDLSLKPLNGSKRDYLTQCLEDWAIPRRPVPSAAQICREARMMASLPECHLGNRSRPFDSDSDTLWIEGTCDEQFEGKFRLFNYDTMRTFRARVKHLAFSAQLFVPYGRAKWSDPDLVDNMMRRLSLKSYFHPRTPSFQHYPNLETLSVVFGPTYHYVKQVTGTPSGAGDAETQEPPLNDGENGALRTCPVAIPILRLVPLTPSDVGNIEDGACVIAEWDDVDKLMTELHRKMEMMPAFAPEAGLSLINSRPKLPLSATSFGHEAGVYGPFPIPRITVTAKKLVQEGVVYGTAYVNQLTFWDIYDRAR